MNILLLLCLALLIINSAIVNGQQCMDLMSPFVPTAPLMFCGQYSTYGCCTSQDDSRLREMFREIRFQNRQIENARVEPDCLRYVKTILCARCSPFSAEIFQVKINQSGDIQTPRVLPGLCGDFCKQFYDRCIDVLQGYFAIIAKNDNEIEEVSQLNSLTYTDNSASFCKTVALAPRKTQYCLPIVDSTFGESSKFTTEKVNKADCVCLQPYEISLRNPVVITSANDGTGRLFIAEQIGAVKIMFSDGRISQNYFLDIQSKVHQNVDDFSQLGLLGLTFHPEFKDNNKLYVFYTFKKSNMSGVYSRVEEYRVHDTDANSVDLDTSRVIIEIQKNTVNHAGGSLLFGKDGNLYIFTGDDGGDGDSMEISQDLFMLSGKVLRVNIDVTDFIEGKEYSVPSDNPFAGKETMGLPEIYAWGLRNPRGCSIDRAKSEDRIFCGDVGVNTYEEINIIKREGNYGWNIKEGTADFCPDCLRGLPEVNFTDPVFEYRHTIGVSVIGGNVYRGCLNPNLQDQYIFGDFKTGLFRLIEDSKKQTWTGERLEICPPSHCIAPLTSHIQPYILSFGEDEEGELYVLTTSSANLTSSTGRMYKIVDPVRRGNPKHCKSARPIDGISGVTGEFLPNVLPFIKEEVSPRETPPTSSPTSQSTPRRQRPVPGTPQRTGRQRDTNQRPRSRLGFIGRFFGRRRDNRNGEGNQSSTTNSASPRSRPAGAGIAQQQASPRATQQGSGVRTLGGGAVVVNGNQGATVIRVTGKK